MKPHELHRSAATERLGFLVITVSTSRYNQKKKKRAREDLVDDSGDKAEAIISRTEHRIVGRELISDSASMLRSSVRRAQYCATLDITLLQRKG